jgi:hypothetical protein
LDDQLRSVLLGTAGLSVAAVAAVALTLTRGAIGQSREIGAVTRLAMVALLTQAVHFAEELATGFQQRFPALFGLTPWSDGFFVAFNLFWLAIWAVSIWSLASRGRWVLFPLWFLAIAGCANGVAHPLLSLRAAGYFPGLFTSPFVGVAGAALLRRLLSATGNHG